MTRLAVAAVSARMLAEAAARDGYGVVALDLFGDADTRRVSRHWHSIGAPGAFRIDASRVLDALQRIASQHADAVLGWVPGSGFEGLPGLLDAGSRILPMIGTPADAVRRVRDPALFFGALAEHGIGHPEVSPTMPVDAGGWLSKDAGGCGGWHIRRVDADFEQASDQAWPYFQREMHGVPMSATFIADGARAMLLGINELSVGPVGTRPHVYRGCIGPVSVAPALARLVGDAVRLLTAEFGLRGWCSLDFIRDGDAIGVLEVNPRPPASLSLYAQRGVIDAHLRACLQAELPRTGAFATRCVAGTEIVNAAHASTLDAAGARRLAARAGVHDLPAAGTRFAAGDPVCTLSATGDSAAHVKARLGAARDALIKDLETTR